jgi:hypothetical protein
MKYVIAPVAQKRSIIIIVAQLIPLGAAVI